MTDTPSRRRWYQFGLRTMFVVVTVAACLVGVYSCDFEQLLFPTTVYSKSSFTPQEVSTLTRVLEVDLPPNARVDLASYHKSFGPGGGNITVRMQMPTAEAKDLRALIVRRQIGHEHQPHLDIYAPLPEWREANQTLESSFGLQAGTLFFSKPQGGQVSAYIDFEDYASACFQILQKGEKRRPLPRYARP